MLFSLPRAFFLPHSFPVILFVLGTQVWPVRSFNAIKTSAFFPHDSLFYHVFSYFVCFFERRPYCNMYATIFVYSITFADELSVTPGVFSPLPLGSVQPCGWMNDQMQLMSDGLAGHMYDFYHFVHSSPWIGGHSEYSVLNEGLPYWFNGLVPLAYGLGDTRLQSQVIDASNYIIDHQGSDGQQSLSTFCLKI